MMIRLTLRWMFEAAVCDGAQKFALQQEIAETGRVDTDVAALLVGAAAGDSQVALLVGVAIGGSRSGGGGGSCGGLQLLVGVIDEIFFVRHGEGELAGLKDEKWRSWVGKDVQWEAKEN